LEYVTVPLLDLTTADSGFLIFALQTKEDHSLNRLLNTYSNTFIRRVKTGQVAGPFNSITEAMYGINAPIFSQELGDVAIGNDFVTLNRAIDCFQNVVFINFTTKRRIR
jgi:hypothetical protein